MIERYTRPEMGAIWSEQNKYSIWLEIEILATEAQSVLGIVPPEDVALIRQRAGFDVARILEIEETTKHDVIAFLTNVNEHINDSASRWLHLGMTSSDVLDTCLSVQLKQSGELLLKELHTLKNVLEQKAREYKHTICVGRSHGIHAEPMTFGLKFLLYYEEAKRNIERLESAIKRISVGMISGAIGTFEHISPFVEEYVCSKLNLEPAPVSTQVIQRDRHSEFLSTLAIIGSSLEKIALEIRHLQRTEVREAEEYFSKGQKGSSAMPHKRNPIVSERICGLARLLRANAHAAMENNALWHERDISHSSVERVICPDSTITLDYMLGLTIKLVDTLLVYPENMQKTIERSHGLVYSQTVLLELVKRGLTRESAYAIVQSSAMRTWMEQIPLYDTLRENAECMSVMNENELRELLDGKKSVPHLDAIYKRCGLE
jgi:adenylosuccinate lyase